MLVGCMFTAKMDQWLPASEILSHNPTTHYCHHDIVLPGSKVWHMPIVMCGWVMGINSYVFQKLIQP